LSKNPGYATGGVLGEMFRFLYAKILCRPRFAIKRRREMERRIKLEEESGINIHCSNTNGWSIGDNNNTNSTKKNQQIHL
jgi:hypothetical protein